MALKNLFEVHLEKPQRLSHMAVLNVHNGCLVETDKNSLMNR